MSFQQDKIIQLSDFLGAVHTRLEQGGSPSTLAVFDTSLQIGLPIELQRRRMVSATWDGRVNAGDFDTIYPLAAEILHDVASRMYSEAHPDSYRLAHQVSEALCGQLNDTFECSGEEEFELIPVKSFVEMMAEAGLVRVDNGMVSLTPEGEETAQSFGKEVRR
jgi:Mn-dependent DtxR family transcriptional regulator